MRVALLVGPAAGTGRAPLAAQELRLALVAGGAQVQVLLGRDRPEAMQLARDAVADGVDVLVAVGGDGTVHLALQALALSTALLGVLPAGTGNDLARALGVATEPQACARAVLDGAWTAVDAVRTGSQWWAGVLGTGFDAAVTERANRMRWPRGRRRYDLATLAELRTLRPQPLVLELDGRRLEVEALLVAVGGAPSYGGGMRVCPGARLDDGLLEVVVVGPLSRWQFVRLFPSVFRGTHIRHPSVTVHTARKIGIDGPPLPVYADGEPMGELPTTCTVVPGAVRVVGAHLGT